MVFEINDHRGNGRVAYCSNSLGDALGRKISKQMVKIYSDRFQDN